MTSTREAEQKESAQVARRLADSAANEKSALRACLTSVLRSELSLVDAGLTRHRAAQRARVLGNAIHSRMRAHLGVYLVRCAPLPFHRRAPLPFFTAACPCLSTAARPSLFTAARPSLLPTP